MALNHKPALCLEGKFLLDLGISLLGALLTGLCHEPGLFVLVGVNPAGPDDGSVIGKLLHLLRGQDLNCAKLLPRVPLLLH